MEILPDGTAKYANVIGRIWGIEGKTFTVGSGDFICIEPHRCINCQYLEQSDPVCQSEPLYNKYIKGLVIASSSRDFSYFIVKSHEITNKNMQEIRPDGIYNFTNVKSILIDGQNIDIIQAFDTEVLFLCLILSWFNIEFIPKDLDKPMLANIIIFTNSDERTQFAIKNSISTTKSIHYNGGVITPLDGTFYAKVPFKHDELAYKICMPTIIRLQRRKKAN